MKLYKKINEADLIDYLQSVKDTNSLHYGKNPIIPGNFLLFILEEIREFCKVYRYKLSNDESKTFLYTNKTTQISAHQAI